MCYNFATFVLYLDVITLIYRENRLTSSETSLSAINAENQQIAKQTPSFTPKNVKLGVFVLFKPLVLCFGYRTVFFGSSQKVCGYNI